MTTLLSLDFNAGTNGAAITTATEPSLSFAQGTLHYDNVHTIGLEAAKCDTGTGGSGTFCSLRKDFTAVADISLTSNFWVAALPSATVTLSILTTGTVTGVAMKLNTLGQILLLDGSTTVDTSTVTVTPGARVYYEWNASSTHAAQELRIFVGADIGTATPTEVLSGTYTAATTFTRHQAGALGTPPVNFQVWYDSIVVTDVYVPPYVPPTSDQLVLEGFEAGSAGAAVTVTDFDSSTGTWVYDNANTVGLLSATTTTAGTAYFTKAFTAVADVTAKCDIWLGSLPAATMTVASVLNGATTVATVRVKPDGTLILVNGQPGFGGVQVAGTLASVTANQRIHLEWHVNSSTSLQELRLFLSTEIGGTQPTEHVGGAYSGGTISTIRMGVVSSASSTMSLWLDGVDVTDLYEDPYTDPPATVILANEGFEGAADGVAMNSSNTLFTTFSGSGTRAFSTAQAKEGTRSAFFDSLSSAFVATITKSFVAVTGQSIFARWYCYMPAIPATNTSIVRFSSGGAAVCTIRQNAAGTVSLMNGTSVAGTSGSLPVGQWVRMDWTVRLGLSTQTLGIFTGANLEGLSANQTVNGAVSGTSVDAFLMGIIFGQPANWHIHFDDVAVSTASMPAPTGPPLPATNLYYLKAGVWTPLIRHRL